MLFRTPAFVAASLSLAVRHLSSYFTGRIDSDANVVFFPTIGQELNYSHWEVPVHGWIFEPEKNSTRRRAFKALLRKSLNVTKERSILDRRVEPFLVDNSRLRSPRIRFVGSDTIHKMPRSSKNGHFRTTLQISKDDIMIREKEFLQFEAVAADGRRFPGRVHLVSNNNSNLSVISDIDDTIKVSNVTNTKRLLRNTFLEEFRPVPGMADLYGKWKKKGAMFHFVSSSPFQLYEELENFRIKAQFPKATYHLKTIRVKDKTILNLFADPIKTKTTEITSIIECFPQRKFILVGDSGEKDPEVYGQIARNFPNQVVAIFIRQVSCGKLEGGQKEKDKFDDRFRSAFSNITEEKWKVFVDPNTIQLPPNID